jgi:hypothetical protein
MARWSRAWTVGRSGLARADQGLLGGRVDVLGDADDGVADDVGRDLGRPAAVGRLADPGDSVGAKPVLRRGAS